MAIIENIPPTNHRNPCFRLWWENTGTTSWKDRTVTFVNIFHRFLFETYGSHFYFEWEDIAISGDFSDTNFRIYIVFHCWFVIENQTMEDDFYMHWDDWMEQQEFDDTERVFIVDPKTRKYIWNSGPEIKKYQVLLPGNDPKVQILSTQHGYLSNSNWFMGGIYDTDGGYFYFHNWQQECGSWLEGKNKKMDKNDSYYGEDRFVMNHLVYSLP